MTTDQADLVARLRGHCEWLREFLAGADGYIAQSDQKRLHKFVEDADLLTARAFVTGAR